MKGTSLKSPRDIEYRHTASAGGTGSSDIVIFYTADHDLSSIRRDEESEFLIEDNTASQAEQA
jgi:hypothetical protein